MALHSGIGCWTKFKPLPKLQSIQSLFLYHLCLVWLRWLLLELHRPIKQSTKAIKQNKQMKINEKFDLNMWQRLKYFSWEKTNHSIGSLLLLSHRPNFLYISFLLIGDMFMIMLKCSYIFIWVTVVVQCMLKDTNMSNAPCA